MSIHNKIGKNIKYFRLQRNLTIEELSSLTKISKQRLKNIENTKIKKRLTINEINTIAKSLNIEISLFFVFDTDHF